MHPSQGLIEAVLIEQMPFIIVLALPPPKARIIPLDQYPMPWPTALYNITNRPRVKHKQPWSPKAGVIPLVSNISGGAYLRVHVLMALSSDAGSKTRVHEKFIWYTPYFLSLVMMVPYLQSKEAHKRLK